MLSEITSVLDFIKGCSEEFSKKPFKSIITLLVSLSIVLVKPIIYYSTFYVDFCKKSSIMLIMMILFCICYKIYHRTSNEYYDKETVNYLIGFSILLFIIILVSSISCTNVFKEIFSNENLSEKVFKETIHNKEYFKKFYDYVLSNFLLVLIYSIEFVQMVLITYLFVYVLNKLIFTEEPLKNGFSSKDIIIMIINSLFIFLSSPIMYNSYSDFWNNIF